jgi:hypothetical protein
MNRAIEASLLALAIASATIPLVTANAQAAIDHSTKVTLNGFGGVRIGMTVAAARRAAGVALVEDGSGEPACYHVLPKTALPGMGFMVTDGKIARVSVWSNRQIATLSGAKIGDTEARIKALYPGRIQVTPHTYVSSGHYLTFVPKDARDRHLRLVFETDGNRVTAFHAGKLPEVGFVEGCS